MIAEVYDFSLSLMIIQCPHDEMNDKFLDRKVKWSEVAQSCPPLCDPMDCSLPGSSVHGIFKARVLGWVAISFSKMKKETFNLLKNAIVGERNKVNCNKMRYVKFFWYNFTKPWDFGAGGYLRISEIQTFSNMCWGVRSYQFQVCYTIVQSYTSMYY